VSGEKVGVKTTAKIIAVNFHVGDQVRKGDVLLGLETDKLDNDIAKQKGLIQAAEEEWEKLGRLAEFSQRQYEAARAKAEAELAQAAEEVRQAKAKHAGNVRLAELELNNALSEEAQLRRLVAKGAEAAANLVKASTRAREAKEKLDQVRLPVDEGRLEVLRRALTVIEKDYALRAADLEIKRGLKRSEMEAARRDLANRELEREQTVIRAHVDGIVTWGHLRVGDLLAAGKPVFAIAQQKGLRIDIPVPTKDVAHLKVGMTARIKLDAFEYQQYGVMEGKVIFISPDSEVPDGQRGSV
jgi:HlyD family secretion protein